MLFSVQSRDAKTESMEREDDEDLLLPEIRPFEESPLELICPHCDSKVFTTVTVSFRR